MNSLVKTELEAICDEAKKIEHVTNCTADYGGGDQIRIVVESFLANDDGSRVERGRGIVIRTPEKPRPSGRGGRGRQRSCRKDG